MKIALIIGHNVNSKGAYSENLGMSEFDFYNKVLDTMFDKYSDVFGVSTLQMKKIKEDTVIFRVPNTGYSKEMQKVVDTLNSKNFDIAIELHFNASNGKANGTTVLYWHKSQKGLELANLFQDVMAESTGVTKRDLIPVKSASQNGAYGIMNAKCPYILIEPFFGDSKVDTDKVSVQKLADVMFEYLNIINDVVIVDKECNENEKITNIISKLLSAIEDLKDLIK